MTEAVDTGKDNVEDIKTGTSELAKIDPVKIESQASKKVMPHDDKTYTKDNAQLEKTLIQATILLLRNWCQKNLW